LSEEKGEREMKISVEILEEGKRRGGKSENPRDIFCFHCNFGDETRT
jgi:hypothetical protein